MLGEMAPVLQPGGHLVLTVAAYRMLWGAQDEISHLRRRYRASELVSRISAPGLRLTGLSYFQHASVPTHRRWAHSAWGHQV